MAEGDGTRYRIYDKVLIKRNFKEFCLPMNAFIWRKTSHKIMAVALQQFIRGIQYGVAGNVNARLVLNLPHQIEKTATVYALFQIAHKHLDKMSSQNVPEEDFNIGAIKPLSKSLEELYNYIIEKEKALLAMQIHPIDVAANFIVCVAKSGPSTKYEDNVQMGVTFANWILIPYEMPLIDFTICDNEDFKDAVNECVKHKNTSDDLRKIHCNPLIEVLDKLLWEKGHTCMSCGITKQDLKKDNTELKKCSRCKFVYYCCNECQSKNWMYHKSFCNDNRNVVSALNHEKSKQTKTPPEDNTGPAAHVPRATDILKK